MNVWQAAADLIRQSRSGAMATVARARGSTPVPAGTKMLVGSEGRLIGSVGGGCVEADVIGAALDVQARGRPALVTHHLNADLAGDLGLSCGGTVDIFVEPLLADDAYVRVLERAARAESGLVRTATEWPKGPVKTFEPLAKGLTRGAAATLTRDGRFVEECLLPAPHVLVFGAGHVGAPIARAASAAGFRVVLIDDRPEYADPSRFETGVTVLVADVETALARYSLTGGDAGRNRGERRRRAVRLAPRRSLGQGPHQVQQPVQRIHRHWSADLDTQIPHNPGQPIGAGSLTINRAPTTSSSGGCVRLLEDLDHGAVVQLLFDDHDAALVGTAPDRHGRDVGKTNGVVAEDRLRGLTVDARPGVRGRLAHG